MRFALILILSLNFSGIVASNALPDSTVNWHYQKVKGELCHLQFEWPPSTAEQNSKRIALLRARLEAGTTEKPGLQWLNFARANGVYLSVSSRGNSTVLSVQTTVAHLSTAASFTDELFNDWNADSVEFIRWKRKVEREIKYHQFDPQRHLLDSLHCLANMGVWQEAAVNLNYLSLDSQFNQYLRTCPELNIYFAGRLREEQVHRFFKPLLADWVHHKTAQVAPLNRRQSQASREGLIFYCAVMIPIDKQEKGSFERAFATYWLLREHSVQKTSIDDAWQKGYFLCFFQSESEIAISRYLEDAPQAKLKSYLTDYNEAVIQLRKNPNHFIRGADTMPEFKWYSETAEFETGPYLSAFLSPK